MSIASSVQALHKKIDLAKLRAEKKVTAYIEQRVRVIFTDIVSKTPQFTGTLAGNWHIEYGPWTGSSYTPGVSGIHTAKQAYALMNDSPYKRGDNPAVSETLAIEFKKLEGLGGAVAGRIRWNSKIYFVNTAPYADEVDQGIGPNDYSIRPENLYYGKVFLTTRAKIKYPELK